MGSCLGILNIGAGRGQEPEDWIQRLREREDWGSKQEPEIKPDLRLCSDTCLFAQLPW